MIKRTSRISGKHYSKQNILPNRIIRFAGIWLLLYCFTGISYAQTSELPLKPASEAYVFKEIKSSGDTPIRDIKDMLQDRYGFVWMAGKHGLMRYDGHDFKIFRNIPGDSTSITNTDLLSLYLLGDTILCIGSKYGVSLMDIRTEKIINRICDQENKPVEYINSFFFDSDGTIWIAALNGLYSLKPDLSGIINHHLDIPSLIKGNQAFAKRVYCITEHATDKNLLMLGTEYGLVSFDKKRDVLYKTYPNKQATFWRSHPGIYKFEKEGNYLWTMSWISGIPRFDMVNEQWENFAYPQPGDRLETTDNIWAISDLKQKNKDEIWVCDWDRGLFVFDKKHRRLNKLQSEKNSTVLQNPQMKIFRFDNGSLWLSNSESLWKQNQQAHLFRKLDIPYSHAWVSDIFHDKQTGEYYFGMSWESYGLACWNSQNRKWTFYRPETEKDKMFNTNKLFKDSREILWIASSLRGLWFVDKQNKTLKRFIPPDTEHLDIWTGSFFAIFEDSRNNLWLGTGKNGVVRLNPERNKADYFENNPEDPTSLTGKTHFRTIKEDRYGKIWIGSLTGFCTFDPETETFSGQIQEELYKTGIRGCETYAIVKDSKGIMWLTLTGQGLVRIEENPPGKFHFKTFQTDEGLKDLSVKFMTKDEQGGLWIVNNGLLYMNPDNNSYMLTDTRNGLLEDIDGDNYIFVDRDGNVFCGEQVGPGWLNAAQKHPQSGILNLIIENITVNTQTIDDWNPYTEKPLRRIFDYNKNNFTFKYTAICFEDYDQVRYRYKLEGLDKEWNPPTKLMEARYTNLKPEKYRFRVDAVYKGKWSGNYREVYFEIRQAFWNTWWFMSTALFGITAIFLLFYLNRIRFLEKQRRIRLKIASDLHDDIGSTLSSISIMSGLLQSQPRNDNQTAEMIRKIGENAQNMLDSMDDIIWSVNPKNDDFRNLISRVRAYAIPLFESRDIRFVIEAPENILSLHVPMETRRNLFLIAKEAINNLVKYSGCSEAHIKFSYSHAVIKMTVTDNGKGFDISKNYDRNGLRNMKFRGGKVGGKVIVHSAPGKGTTVTFSVKIEK